MSDTMSDALYVEVGIRLVNSLSQCAGRSLMSVPKLLSWLHLIHTCNIRPDLFVNHSHWWIGNTIMNFFWVLCNFPCLRSIHTLTRDLLNGRHLSQHQCLQFNSKHWIRPLICTLASQSSSARKHLIHVLLYLFIGFYIKHTTWVSRMHDTVTSWISTEMCHAVTV